MLRAVEFLLWSQLITADALPHRVWRVVQGSGMGLPHSGELADILLLLKEVQTVLDPSFCQQIRAYCRYKDDLIIAVDDVGNANVATMWWHFKHGCLPYVVKPDEVNRDGFTMLDVTFFKGDTWNRSKQLDYKPFIKPSSLGMVLNSTSNHVPTIHEQWPLAEIKRYQRLSSTRGHFEVARDLFVQRMKKFDAQDHVIASIHNTFPRDRKQVDQATSLRHWHRILQKMESNKNCVWLPFPFHTAWFARGVASCIRKYCTSPLAESLLKPLGVTIQCRVAWKLTSRPISLEIATASKYKPKRD